MPELEGCEGDAQQHGIGDGAEEAQDDDQQERVAGKAGSPARGQVHQHCHAREHKGNFDRGERFRAPNGEKPTCDRIDLDLRPI